jgi:hypothetical protein
MNSSNVLNIFYPSYVMLYVTQWPQLLPSESFV